MSGTANWASGSPRTSSVPRIVPSPVCEALITAITMIAMNARPTNTE